MGPRAAAAAAAAPGRHGGSLPLAVRLNVRMVAGHGLQVRHGPSGSGRAGTLTVAAAPSRD